MMYDLSHWGVCLGRRNQDMAIVCLSLKQQHWSVHSR